MSHHVSIRMGGVPGEIIGHARITNRGHIISIWIKTDKQQMLFFPEQPIPKEFLE